MLHPPIPHPPPYSFKKKKELFSFPTSKVSFQFKPSLRSISVHCSLSLLRKLSSACFYQLFSTAFDQALAHGTVNLRTARVLVLGVFGSGKTSLLRALRGHDFSVNLFSTCGITYQTTTTCLSTPGQVGALPLLSQDPESRQEELGAQSARSYTAELPFAPDETNLSTDTTRQNRVETNAETQAWISDLQRQIPEVSKDALVKVQNVVEGDVSKEVFVETLDCGGQLSFSTTQSICLESANSVFLLTTSCQYNLHDRVEKAQFHDPETEKTVIIEQQSADYSYLDYIQMWVSSVVLLSRKQTRMPTPSFLKRSENIKPLIILVATHFDEVDAEKRFEKKREMQKILNNEVIRPANEKGLVRIEGPYFVDNRALGSGEAIKESEMHILQSVLSDEIKTLAQPESIPLRWLTMERLIKLLPEKMDKFSGVLSIKQIRELLVSPLVSGRQMPPPGNELRAILLYLDWRGTVKLPAEVAQRLKDATSVLNDDFKVFIDMQWLALQLSKVTTSSLRGAADHPSHLYDDVDALQNNGELSGDLMNFLWRDLTQSMRDQVLQIMQELQLAFRVRKKRRSSFSARDPRYIIPRCISAGVKGMADLDGRFHDRLPPLRLLMQQGIFPIALYHRIVVCILESIDPEDFELDFKKLRLRQLGQGDLPGLHQVGSLCFVLEHVYRGIELAVYCQCVLPEETCKKNMSAAGRAFRSLVRKMMSLVLGEPACETGWNLAFRCKNSSRHSVVFKTGSGSDCSLAYTLASQHEIESAKSIGYNCVDCKHVRISTRQAPSEMWLSWLLNATTPMVRTIQHGARKQWKQCVNAL